GATVMVEVPLKQPQFLNPRSTTNPSRSQRALLLPQLSLCSTHMARFLARSHRSCKPSLLHCLLNRIARVKALFGAFLPAPNLSHHPKLRAHFPILIPEMNSFKYLGVGFQNS